MKRYFESTLSAAAAEPGWRAICAPIPSVELEAPAFDPPGSPAFSFLWDPPNTDDASFSGFGAAAEIELVGDVEADRVRLAEHSGTVFAALKCFVHPDVRGAPSPRFFGGMAFGSGTAAPWQDFGPGRFVLPRWMYAEGPSGRTLTLALGPDEGRDAHARALVMAELSRFWEAARPDPFEDPDVDADGFGSPSARGGRVLEGCRIMSAPSLEDWCKALETIRHLIEDGTAQKIVAARTTRVDFERAFSHAQAARALRGRPMCTRFAFRRKGMTFLGATPELLVKKVGARIYSEALAGSAPVREVEAMIASRKEQSEHALVVEFIADALRAIAGDVEHPRSPEVRRLEDVVHLVTPVFARLDEGRTIFDVLGALHPTPAVAGVPRARALAWIREHEPFFRGWYAAPVGWFAADGDGELRVALRSALLGAGSAHLFAGAGIVKESDPRAEYEEARLKERPLRRALGVEA